MPTSYQRWKEEDELRDELNSTKIKLDFYKSRVSTLEKEKHRFPEPCYKMICDILADGKIKVE